MGYTHYWKYNPNGIEDTEELRKKFRKAVTIIDKAHKMIKKDTFLHKGQAGGCYDDVPCLIRGGLGEGTPMINESQVWFNGDEKSRNAHETFGIRWFEEVQNTPLSPRGKHDFCKTARKPYDLLVCVALLAFKYAFHDPEVFTFSSDGHNSEWEPAKDLFTRITGSFVGKIFPEE